MPIENERKYVILETPAVERLFQEAANRAVWIEQKYLSNEKGISLRVRLSACEGVHAHHMTFKRDVDGDTVEIENPISEEDFRKLWKVGFGKVTKMRYLYQGWEVDFFKDKRKQTYLAIAEIELPPKMMWPESIPEHVQNNLIYTVPVINGQNDKRFSNKRLGDIDYARNLLNEVKAKSKIHLPPVQHEVKIKKKKFR